MVLINDKNLINKYYIFLRIKDIIINYSNA